jgi:protein-S-isoprenylcysteine O-methyltransferase Ste14
LADRTYNKALGFLRVISMYVIVGLLAVLSRPTPSSVSLGAILIILGESIRFWAAGHLFKTVELITSGPYRFTRNPLYLGRLLIFTGICVAAPLPYFDLPLHWIVLALGWAVFFGYYLRRKERVEPARLRETHGEPYDRYFKAVPALFPTLRPYGQASSTGWSSDRMLRNREHWMVIGLVVVILALLWRAYNLAG